MIEPATTKYQLETPRWLWKGFTGGPANEYDRYEVRLLCLQAVDVLENNPEELTEEQRKKAKRLAQEVEFYDGR